jgi:aspartokinase-like uncharacterized kinase
MAVSDATQPATAVASRPRARVVRLGGSLLDDPQVVSRLRAWLAAQSPAPNILVVGGGAWVQAVRQAFATLGLSQTSAHWLSIQAMGLTARLALALWPEAELLVDLEAAHGWKRLEVPAVLDVQRFLEQDAARGGPGGLPQDWSVTSDSIAAAVAVRLAAHELVLLKSALPRPPYSLAHAAATGYVDGCFPQAAQGIPMVRCVNLRAAEMPSVSLCAIESSR